MFLFFLKKKKGNQHNSYCPVHPNFKCVILVEEKDLELQDPPFLNRFEKQILDFQSSLNEQDILLINNVDKMLKIKIEDFNLDKFLFSYNKEDLFALVYFLKVHGKIVLNSKVILRILLQLATGDFLLALKVLEMENNMISQTKNFIEQLRNLYFFDNHESLEGYLLQRVKILI